MYYYCSNGPFIFQSKLSSESAGVGFDLIATGRADAGRPRLAPLPPAMIKLGSTSSPSRPFKTFTSSSSSSSSSADLIGFFLFFDGPATAAFDGLCDMIDLIDIYF